MRKNGEFTGVDEKYIPEEEKNVNKSVSGSKEKMSNSTKAIIIGGICFGVIILAIIIFILSIPFRIFNTSRNLINNTQGIIDDTKDQISSVIEDMDKEDGIINDAKNQILSEANKQMIQNFNDEFERYGGTKQKATISALLDKVVTNNKKEKEHIITVKYNETVSNKTEDIVKIKHSLETGKMYEVLLDYDEDGYVNQVTISDI